MSIIDTERLRLRQLEPSDAPFILELLNDPSWIQNIGDRGVRTLDDAKAYIADGPNAMYQKHGVSLLLVEIKQTNAPIGLCGLLKRDTLEDVDLGYALLPAYHGKGYAAEAAAATLRHGVDVHGLSRIVAITLPTNRSSIRLLEKLQFAYEKTIPAPKDGEILALYGWSAAVT
ncbi:MAG: GNAT family N-acetyltransferase [Myxococcota bacterium]